jgi:uncharacterized membrane-anchored protein
MQDHELRRVLNDELHGRPGLPVTAPSRITHLAFTLEAHDPDPLINVSKLCDAYGVKPPAPGAVHHAAEIEGGLLKYERHGEFFRASMIAPGSDPRTEAIALLPIGWLDGLPGKRIVAIHTHILKARSGTVSPRDLVALFGHDDLASSSVSQGKALIWTDFRIAEDGYSRLLVLDRGLSPMRLGRVVRRLHEIETYRMMALLAFPLARQMQQELGPLEQRLTTIINGMTQTRSPEEDKQLLHGLSTIAHDVEELSNRASFRFAAARAYAALVNKRISELGEERVMNYQRLGVFLDRRFSPAMTTCTAVADRIAGLAARSERASNLLRTRVDIALEAQNQELLRSMETRGRQQLMLQETVEGLSVVAISYYLIAIVSKLLEAAAEYVPWLHARIVSLLIIPLVLVFVWLAIRSIRRRVHGAADKL